MITIETRVDLIQVWQTFLNVQTVVTVIWDNLFLVSFLENV